MLFDQFAPVFSTTLPSPLTPPGALLSYGIRFFSPLQCSEKNIVDELFKRNQFLMLSW